MFKVESSGTYFIYCRKIYRAVTAGDMGSKEDMKRFVVENGLERLTGEVESWVD